jgi:hypothetical protein
MDNPALTPEQFDAALATGDPELIAMVRRFQESSAHPFNSWKPRPDTPLDHDEQTAFVECKSPIQICLGGTGSGKSDAAAFKVANFMLKDQPPPRKNTPFWVVGGGGMSMERTCSVLWGEKLSRFVPPEAIDHIAWYKAGMDYPKAVRLKTHANGNNWQIEFMAETMGRKAMQGASIGGAWLSETLNDFGVLQEIIFRTRDYAWTRIFWDLTPLEPQNELEENEQKAKRNELEGWSFFHLNALRNTALPPGEIARNLANTPEELRETRCWGAFSSFEGVVFREIQPKHIIEPIDIPPDWQRTRSMDFGTSFGCVWLAFDSSRGCWYVTNEYYKEDGAMIAEHAACINAVPWRLGATFGDPADQTSIRELSRYDIHVSGALKDTEASIELIRRLLIADRLFFFNSCGMTIRQCRAYRRKKGSSEIYKHWDHLVDALRYGIYSRSAGVLDFPTRPLEIAPRERRPVAQQGGHIVQQQQRNSTLPVFRQRRPRAWG